MSKKKKQKTNRTLTQYRIKPVRIQLKKRKRKKTIRSQLFFDSLSQLSNLKLKKNTTKTYNLTLKIKNLKSQQKKSVIQMWITISKMIHRICSFKKSRMIIMYKVINDYKTHFYK